MVYINNKIDLHYLYDVCGIEIVTQIIVSSIFNLFAASNRRVLLTTFYIMYCVGFYHTNKVF